MNSLANVAKLLALLISLLTNVSTVLGLWDDATWAKPQTSSWRAGQQRCGKVW
uniref:Inner membrane protein n=1 Tax=Angiostrongylus cantonensis TaxID=6313 RepID=A0A0K0D3D4_ANGCA